MGTAKSFHEILEERMRKTDFQRENAFEHEPNTVSFEWDPGVFKADRHVFKPRFRPGTTPYPRGKRPSARPVRPKTKPLPTYFIAKLGQSVAEAAARLGLPDPFTTADLKRRYRELAKRSHPDLHPGQPSMAFIRLKRDFDAVRKAISECAGNGSASE